MEDERDTRIDKKRAKNNFKKRHGLTLILSANIGPFGILRVKAVTRLRNRLYGIPIAVMERGWKRKWASLRRKDKKDVA